MMNVILVDLSDGFLEALTKGNEDRALFGAQFADDTGNPPPLEAHLLDKGTPFRVWQKEQHTYPGIFRDKGNGPE